MLPVLSDLNKVTLELTPAEVQAIEDKLNNDIFNQAHVTIDLVLLDPIEVNYDFTPLSNPDQKLTLGLLLGQQFRETDIIIAGGDDDNFHHMIFIVKHVIVGGASTDAGAATMASDPPNDTSGKYIFYGEQSFPWTVDNMSHTFGHELVHAMGCPHPFEYENYDYIGFEYERKNNYDSENLMSYQTTEAAAASAFKLRFYQWVRINSLVEPQ